jgi:predicted transposase YbfD/YdcC
MQSIITIFRDVQDPRDVNARHILGSMLFISLAATLCGAKSFVDIADFADAHVDTLGEIVDLPHGAPSHDSFSRVFRLLDPEELATALTRFAAALRQGLGIGPAKGVVAIDGKSLRRGYERGRAFMPPLMVSVWDAETRLSIATRRAEGGDEIAATLAALKSLVLKGCIVTADALHCHPRMAAAVRATGAHYALGLKANHGPLYAAAGAAFAQAEAAGKLVVHEHSESGHGRLERRRVAVVARPANAPAFPGLVAIARIEAERRTADGKPTRPCATSPSPSGSPPLGFWKSPGPIGVSRMTSTGSSMSSSTRTTPAPARITRRKILRLSAVWPSTSCEVTPPISPLPEK